MIEHIYLSDNDEHYAPPEKPILEVGLVGDVVFLTIGKYDEKPDIRTFEGSGTTGVSVADLVNAIKILAISQHRHDIVKALGSDRDIRAAGL